MSMFSQWLDNWQKKFSLVVKMLVLTGAAGLFSWLVLDHAVSQRMDAIFQGQSLKAMAQQASEDRMKLHDFFSFHSWAVTLLARQEIFFHYVEKQEVAGWMTQVPEQAVRLENRPSWLPGQSITRKLSYASHILLLDGKFRLREIFSQVNTVPSDEIFTEMLSLNPQTDGQNVLTHVEGILHLVTASALRTPKGEARGWLVFVSPMDDELLYMFQKQYRSLGILAFIDNDTDLVVASSRPDLVAKGVPVWELTKNYHISGKKFLDHGFTSDATVRFATLISLASLAELNQSVLMEERIYRGLSHILLTGIFLLIVYWISRRIEHFMVDMAAFAKDELGLHHRQLQKGDQLEMMKEQFNELAKEIVVARKRDTAQAEALQQVNQALSQSLEVVQRTQSQLVRSEKLAALGSMVAGIAHEINTPAGIAFTASTHLEEETRNIQQQYQNGELRREDLENYFSTATEATTLIQNNLNRATQLIRNFKMVAVDQSSGERRSFNLKDYLEGIVQSLRPKLKRTQITVTIECPAEIILESFPGVFSQIFTNLIVNTLTHGYAPGEVGTIHISAWEDDAEHIVLTYSDAGCGIPPEHLTRIFDPFFTTIRGRGGSGLGLHIVHNLVTQTLNGSISCTNKPGKGATFTIRIPKEENNAVV